MVVQESNPCFIDSDVTCPSMEIPDFTACKGCDVLDQAKHFKRPFSIHLFRRGEGHIDPDLDPSELEGLPYINKDGEIIGYFRNVERIPSFFADLEIVAPLDDDTKRILAKAMSSGAKHLWVGWPSPLLRKAT